MNHLLVIVLSVVLFSMVQCSPVAEPSQVEIVYDINNYLQSNPGVELVPLTRGLERGQIRYTLGNRISGKIIQNI